MKNVISMKEYNKQKNAKDFCDALGVYLSEGAKENPQNPFSYGAKQFEEKTHWTKKDWEAVMGTELDFNTLRNIQKDVQTWYQAFKHMEEAVNRGYLKR